MSRLPFFRTKAYVVRFKPQDFFPLSDKLSLPLLRLIAATNDVRHLQKLVLLQLDQEPTSEVGKRTREGELGYLFRMLCGHLHEAGIAFRNLDLRCKSQVDAMIAKDREAKRLFTKVRKLYNDTSSDGLRHALDTIRNLAFHYDEKDFANALRLNWTDAKFVIAAMAGLTRYTFTDDILKRRTVEAVGGLKNYETVTAGAIELAGILGQAVDHLLVAVLDKSEAYRKQFRRKRFRSCLSSGAMLVPRRKWQHRLLRPAGPRTCLTRTTSL